MASLSAASFGWYLYDGRLAGLYQSPNYLALLIAPAVLLALQLFQASAKGKREKILLIVSLASVLSTLWLTRSYAACSAVGVALAIALVLGRRLRRFPYGPALLLIFVASIFIIGESGSEKWNSLFSGDDRSSLASRVMIWQSATKIAADSFPLGIGIGRFQEVYLEYQRFYPPYLEWAVPTPHNLSLHFFLEGGVLTLFGWLGCISYTLILAGRSLVLSGPSATRPHFLILGVALLVFYLIYGLVDTPYMKNDLALAVWGTLGFILAAEKIKA
jgi:O-antigen ligase